MESQVASRRSRRRLLLLLALLVVVAAACDWPMLGWAPNHSGFSPDTSISRAAVSAGLKYKWTAQLNIGRSVDSSTSSPVIVGGVVYVGSANGGLFAFDAKTGTQLWGGGAGVRAINSTPTVVNGVVYVGGDKLYAFDAAGQTNCSGTPKYCEPLWSSAAAASNSFGSPAVANGVVYVAGGLNSNLFAFDAAGQKNCSGTPKTCAPIWSSPADNPTLFGSTPAVADGIVYVGQGQGPIYAFDGNGTTNCSGTPTTCTPLWSMPAADFWGGLVPVVKNRVVYGPSYDGNLRAFDAKGSTNCTGSPKTCAPLWTAVSGTSSPLTGVAIANGSAFAASASANTLYTFDATGNTNCSGTPKTCTPLWTAAGGAVPPTVANGVVYVASATYDATGTTNCAGTPKTCTPLWTIPLGSTTASIPIANGLIYVHATRDAFSYMVEVIEAYGP